MDKIFMQVNDVLKIDGKKILIVGNRSYRNLGDELILLGTIKLLMKHKKEIYVAAYDVDWLKGFLSKFIDVSEIIFLTEIPKGIRSGLNYLKKGKLKERKEYREVDSIIIGGGEILTEENPNSYRYRLVSILPCYFSGAKIYLMGGIQIPKKEINKWLFNFLLKKTEKIYARDNECVSGIKKYGFENIEFFMDTAYFTYDWSSPSSGAKLNKAEDINKLYSSLHSEGHSKSKGHSKYIVVNLNKNAEKFMDEMIEDIKGYVNKGYDVYFVPVSKGVNDEYNDMMYAKILRDKLGLTLTNIDKNRKISRHCRTRSTRISIAKPNPAIAEQTTGMTKGSIELLDREENFGKLLGILKGAEMIFTGRLHLFLIAKFLGVDVKVYPYQKKILKMQEVMRDFNI